MLALLKPITWFPPMWAFMCGVVSSGVSVRRSGGRFLIAGVLLTGPLVCGTSQAVERLVRPACRCDQRARTANSIGAHSGTMGVVDRVYGTVLSALVAWATGPWVLAATLLGLTCALGL